MTEDNQVSKQNKLATYLKSIAAIVVFVSVTICLFNDVLRVYAIAFTGVVLLVRGTTEKDKLSLVLSAISFFFVIVEIFEKVS